MIITAIITRMKNKITWNAQYSVGHPEMDAQHCRLIALCNHLEDCVDDDSSEGNSRFHEILHELAEYARTHFAAEEYLLDQTGYPDLTEHLICHDNYKSSITEFMFSACLGKLEKSTVHRFILDWWTNHILKSDMQYRDHLASIKG